MVVVFELVCVFKNGGMGGWTVCQSAWTGARSCARKKCRNAQLTRVWVVYQSWTNAQRAHS